MSQVAFIFPGQGSQSVGMGRELADNLKVVREIFQEADDTLKFSISSLCFNGPEEELKLTPNTQPAILTVSIAALQVLSSETGIQPALLTGLMRRITKGVKSLNLEDLKDLKEISQQN